MSSTVVVMWWVCIALVAVYGLKALFDFSKKPKHEYPKHDSIIPEDRKIKNIWKK